MTKRTHKSARTRPVLEILLEEESAVDLLRPVLASRPSVQGFRVEYRRFQGKPDLLANVETRLRGYARQRARGEDVRVLVLVDRDDDDCIDLKSRLEQAAARAGLTTPTTAAGAAIAVVNRIAVHELEAWYYGDWAAVRAAFPKVGVAVPRSHRNPDAGAGKPSALFARTLRKHGYRGAVEHSKREWARRIGPHLEADRSTSASFIALLAGIDTLASTS